MRISIRDCAKLARDSYDLSDAIKDGRAVSGVKNSFDDKGGQALVTVDNVLLIPGTNERSDWIKNFNVINIFGKKFNARDTAKSTTGATFHAGFWHHASQLHRFARDNDVKFIIGHSLGAAAAQILGVVMDVPAVGFASPRVKRGEHKVRHENRILNICRADDLVTRVPPSEAGFRRLGTTVRLIPPEINDGIDHAMKHYIKALDFEAFDEGLPKAWGG